MIYDNIAQENQNKYLFKTPKTLTYQIGFNFMLSKKRKPQHPGEVLLKEFLVPLNLSQKQFVEHLGWTYARLNEIINQRRGVTGDSALAFAEALGTQPEYWLNLQRDWDLWHARQTHIPVKLLMPKKKAA